MNPAVHFSQSYAESRSRFLAAAEARGLALESHLHPAHRGAAGETLAIDVAVLGERTAPGMLLITSGTHGVEGFCGSGCQLGILGDASLLADIAKTGSALVLLHAVNPYGFSWLRRTNEDNIDLNRNFRDFNATLPSSAAYAGIHDFMVPSMWPPAAENEARIGAYVATHGERALQSALSGGQYDYPDGLFYGGAKPAWSNGILRSILRTHGADRKRIGWIDVHTGLGPPGHAEKIFNGADDRESLARAKRWWGADVTSVYDGSSSSAKLSGICGSAVPDECPAVEYAGIALEYGTLPLNDVFAALRADQWLANHPDAAETQLSAIKQQVRDAFYTDTDAWKEAVYRQAIAAVRLAIDSLSRASA